MNVVVVKINDDVKNIPKTHCIPAACCSTDKYSDEAIASKTPMSSINLITFSPVNESDLVVMLVSLLNNDSKPMRQIESDDYLTSPRVFCFHI